MNRFHVSQFTFTANFTQLNYSQDTKVNNFKLEEKRSITPLKFFFSDYNIPMYCTLDSVAK